LTGDYRQIITTLTDNSLNVILSSLSFYTWDQKSQLELFEKIAGKLKVDGQILLVIPKRILEQESENSTTEYPQTKAEQLAENLQTAGLKPQKNSQTAYTFNQTEGFGTLPGGEFVAVTFKKIGLK
jgi:hypothetical protein